MHETTTGQAIEELLGRCVTIATEVLRERLVAMYAIGSVGHGGFSEAVSDVDLAIILTDPLTDADGGEIARFATLVKATAARYADRLSVFWGSKTSLSVGSTYGRFPAVDRLDLLRSGRHLVGKDVRDGLPLPSRRALIVDGAEFALRFLGRPEVLEQLAHPRLLVEAGVHDLSRRILYPVRFLYTARTGEVGRNADAVAHYVEGGGRAAELVQRALRWRGVGPRPGETAGIDGIRALYLEFLDEYIRHVLGFDMPELASALSAWRGQIASLVASGDERGDEPRAGAALRSSSPSDSPATSDARAGSRPGGEAIMSPGEPLSEEQAARIRRRVAALIEQHHPSILSLVGQTELVELRRVNPHPLVRIFGKLEGLNPGGSLKDRVALYLIADAIERGAVRPDTVLLEASSGNAGVALSMMCAVLGLKLLVTLPDNVSSERAKLIRAYGGEVHFTPGEKGTTGAIEAARELGRRPGYVWLSQHFSHVNVLAHRDTTGPEILRQVRLQGLEDLDGVVATSGTTGTLMGVGAYLRQASSRAALHSVWPRGKDHIAGIRRPEWPDPPTYYTPVLIDEVHEVGLDEASQMCAALATKEGIFAGPSSGAAIAAALRIAARRRDDEGPAALVAIICDWGERYLSQVN